MSATGFLENCERGVIEGWAFSPEHDPSKPLLIEILVRGELIGTAEANVYRSDLARDGIGTGDHGFVFRVPRGIAHPSKENVTARYKDKFGHYYHLQHIDSSMSHEPNAFPVIKTYSDCQDKTHSPIFILGSARSGTSAITAALLRCTEYTGQEEGHFLDILAYYYQATEDFFVSKTDELYRNTMISMVPRDILYDYTKSAMIKIAQSLFPNGKWLDKTPSTNMIYIAPVLKEIWPNAKFIFVSRRSLECIRSRRVKFRYSFERDCREWASAANAWLSVKKVLGDSAIRVEQFDMMHSVEKLSQKVAAHLSLDNKTTDRIALFLASSRPQESGFDEKTLHLDDLNLTAEEAKNYEDICSPYMQMLGYSTDKSYFSAGSAYGDSGQPEVGAFYWTASAPDIVSPGRAEQGSF